MLCLSHAGHLPHGTSVGGPGPLPPPALSRLIAAQGQLCLLQVWEDPEVPHRGDLTLSLSLSLQKHQDTRKAGTELTAGPERQGDILAGLPPLGFLMAFSISGAPNRGKTDINPCSTRQDSQGNQVEEIIFS